MFQFILPDKTWFPVTLLRWFVCYGPVTLFFPRALEHPLSKTLWAPLILVAAAIAIHWSATEGVNRFLCRFPHTREYIHSQQAWVAHQRGNGISKRTNVYGDTGEVAAHLVLTIALLMAALFFVAYIIDGPSAL